MEEIWKPITNFDDYYISSYGRVKSYKRNREKILKNQINNQGTLNVLLVNNDRKWLANVTTIVAQEFLGYVRKRTRGIVFKHLDGNLLNNYVDNIEVISAKENYSTICQERYNSEVADIYSKEYKRISYLMKRENITREEYYKNENKYNTYKGRKKHLNYNTNTPEYLKTIALKRVYGINLDEYNELFDSQNGVCAICGEAERTKGKHSNKIISLAVDHCHKTGKIRGLLCRECNKSLGGFKDDSNILLKALKYLRKNK